MNLIKSKMATTVAAGFMMLASLAPEAAYAQTTCPLPLLPNVPQASGRSNFLDPANQTQANVFFYLTSVQDTDPNNATGFYRGAIQNFINQIVTADGGKVLSTITISPGDLRVTKLPGNPRTFTGNFFGLEIGYDDINQLFWYPERIARIVLTDKVCIKHVSQNILSLLTYDVDAIGRCTPSTSFHEVR